ncbi:hypothetical protein [Actinophytocola xanthii]|uniref:Band 7 domain-containing protein n=1 Tax=Actinophytocola xanthii TaxID=1912961 RepID=A0A1Q8CSV2_9PSEU|nr:hypothetical protein [Actinophytocola xanthii]OLF17452.1 hypothetical protein BU204_10910 [Actinophytocola xanthii]
MPTITYDPILDTAAPPRSPVRPWPGTALVLVTVTGLPLVVLYGERVRVAEYRHAHLVDVAGHELRMAARLPTRDPGLAFAATIGFSCQVTNPVMVATSGIRDTAAALRPRLVKILRQTARHYEKADAAVAELALNCALDRYYGNSAMRLGEFTVTLDGVERAPR